MGKHRAQDDTGIVKAQAEPIDPRLEYLAIEAAGGIDNFANAGSVFQEARRRQAAKVLTNMDALDKAAGYTRTYVGQHSGA